MSLQVRRATPADVDVVVDFNCGLAAESEGKTLDRAVLRPGVAAGLADERKALYFLAEEDGMVLGQTMVTYEWSDWRNGWIWWFQSVYVRPEGRRRGVFRALFEHVEELARRDPTVIGMRLYVEEKNVKAHETYLKLGMVWGGYWVMEKLKK